jgi:hypothetical protein
MSLEQYKDASRKELWDILQIQVERIAELETQRARAEILIHELHEQVYDSPYLDNRVGLYEALKETK